MTTPWNPTATVAVDDIATATEWNEVQQNLDHLATPPSAQLLWSANTTLTTSVWADVAFGAENLDTDAFHDNTTNNARVAIPTGLDGRYSFGGYLIFATNGTGCRAVRLRKNGSGTPDNLGLIPGSASQAASVAFYDELVLSAADYVTLQGFQDSGGNLNVIGGKLTVRKVSN